MVACAIALYRGEVFESDADALGSSALLRRQWFVVTGWKISLRASRRQASILQASRFQQPSYREDARYGALTNNSSGNEAFHVLCGTNMWQGTHLMG